MSGRRFRRVTAAAAVALGVVLVVIAVLEARDIPAWSIPLLAAAVLVFGELVSLSGAPTPESVVERQAVRAALIGRLFVASLLAIAGATAALLATAVPARHGFGAGLLGAVAASALFLLVAEVARRGGHSDSAA